MAFSHESVCGDLHLNIDKEYCLVGNLPLCSTFMIVKDDVIIYNTSNDVRGQFKCFRNVAISLISYKYLVE